MKTHKCLTFPQSETCFELFFSFLLFKMMPQLDSEKACFLQNVILSCTGEAVKKTVIKS